MPPAKRKAKPAKSDPRQAKLDAFLQDFDAEVKSRVLQLKEQQHQLLKEVDNRYDIALIKLPRAVRQMNFLLYFGSEKPKSPEVDNSKREQVSELENALAENHTAAPKPLQKTSKKSTSDDENTAPQNTAKKAKSKRPPVASKKTRAQSVSKGNTATRMSTRKPLITPARNMLNSSLMMGATPLVTPRFDPRLPKTPGVRVPRHQERVYSISVNGSPIDSSTKDIVINVPIGNGESIQLLSSQMDSVDLSSLDETALQSIRNLQSRLAMLCGRRE